MKLVFRVIGDPYQIPEQARMVQSDCVPAEGHRVIFAEGAPVFLVDAVYWHPGPHVWVEVMVRTPEMWRRKRKALDELLDADDLHNASQTIGG